jgi:hypothetical protein
MHSASGNRHQLLILLAVAAILRGGVAWQGAIEHFDEGVYATNLYCENSGYQYPDQHLYAPPLWPALLEWTLLLTGSWTAAPIWCTALLGIGLVWWVERLGREWFDPQVGLAAGWLVATNDFLLAYSGTALTDTPLAVCLVATLVTGQRGLKTGSWIQLAQAMGWGALAWWIKYNGWLPLAMLGAGVAGYVVFDPEGRLAGRSLCLRWGLLAAGTCLLWSPLLRLLEPLGGYASVAANHRGYFGGWRLWLPALQSQLLTQWHYLGATTLLGLTAAWLTAVRPISTAGQQQLHPTGGDRFPRWLLAAWVCSLLLAIPLYRPYPRLWVPLQPGLCLLLAIGLVEAARQWTAPRLRNMVCAALVVLAAIVAVVGKFPAWQSRHGLQQTARQLLSELPTVIDRLPRSQASGTAAVVYVLGDPALFFQLSAAESPLSLIIQPIGDYATAFAGPSDPRLPNLLVTGLQAHRDHPELLSKAVPGLRLLIEYHWTPSDLVLLDDGPPDSLPDRRQQMVRVWQMVVPGPALESETAP